MIVIISLVPAHYLYDPQGVVYYSMVHPHFQLPTFYTTHRECPGLCPIQQYRKSEPSQKSCLVSILRWWLLIILPKFLNCHSPSLSLILFPGNDPTDHQLKCRSKCSCVPAQFLLSLFFVGMYCFRS